VVDGVGEEVRKLDPVVVTATTVETPAEQLGASVTVVDGEDFQWEPTGGIGDLKLGVYNPAYARVDAGGTYRLLQRHAFLQGLDLTARVQNLFNESYAEVRGFPALGINALVGLQASF